MSGSQVAKGVEGLLGIHMGIVSCGIFEQHDSSLEDASRAKFERICRKLCLTPGMRVLEIGWGMMTPFLVWLARALTDGKKTTV